MFGTISNDLQKLINDLRKLVLFFTQALNAALRCPQLEDALEQSELWKWGLIFDLAARINHSTATPRIMADIANKYPENVAGKFYVDNQCIDCDLCRETAPNNFKRNDDGGYSFVYKQPSSPEEEAQCKEAKEGCPVEAIGDNGDQA
jgi:ferredoxin